MYQMHYTRGKPSCFHTGILSGTDLPHCAVSLFLLDLWSVALRLFSDSPRIRQNAICNLLHALQVSLLYGPKASFEPRRFFNAQPGSNFK